MATSKPSKPSNAKKKGGRTTAKKTPAAPTSAAAWKNKKKTQPHPVNLPSGNVCLVKRVGMESFLRSGMIPNSLLGIVEGAMKKAQGGKPMTDEDQKQSLQEIASDPEKLGDMFDLVDAVCVSVIIEPQVRAAVWTTQDYNNNLCTLDKVGEEILDEDRDEELLYIDEVDADDKMHIFNYVSGGADDFEKFRSEAGERLEASGLGEGDELPAE